MSRPIIFLALLGVVGCESQSDICKSQRHNERIAELESRIETLHRLLQYRSGQYNKYGLPPWAEFPPYSIKVGDWTITADDNRLTRIEQETPTPTPTARCK